MPSHHKTKSEPAKARPKSRLKFRAGVRPAIPITPRDKLAGKWFEKLVALQARLYGPGGCPWDREQTHQSLRKFLIEETYEVLDAMDSDDPRKFADELGDLLLQVVIHSILAESAGRFTISDVVESVHAKMIRRHPHVFGDVAAKDAAAVLRNWEHLKAAERVAERGGVDSRAGEASGDAPESILGGVPRSLPAVLEAYQLTRRASHVGFDWDNLEGILGKLDEEQREIREALQASKADELPARSRPCRHKPLVKLEEEVGDFFFTVVNVARFLGVDPEIALKKANRKFKQRFKWMEAAAAREGHRFADLPRERMEALWNESKASA